MKTKDFIGQIVRGQRTKPGHCSSVVFDGRNIFSYGYHYPLLVNVAGKWILNITGYSSTTGKHISWASLYADYQMEMKGDDTPSGLLARAEQLIDEYSAQLAKLRKGAFRKKEHLEYRLRQLSEVKDFLSSQE